MSPVDICNMALGHLNQAFISSISNSSSASNPEKACFLYYPIVRNSLLEEYPWSFATRFERLPTLVPLSGQTYYGYDYVFSYPTDCLRIIKLVLYEDYLQPASRSSQENLPFEVQLNKENSSRVVLTNYSDVMAHYIANPIDCNLISPGFALALSYSLAVALSGVLRSSLPSGFAQLAALNLEKAKANDAQQSYFTVDNRSTYSTARDA